MSCPSRFCSWSTTLHYVYYPFSSNLISSLSLNHHLYADDTQLFFSFYPQDLDLSIACLQNALHDIASWMTANLLTLNSSKTEFLLIGLKQQFAKLHDFSLNITNSARNLVLYFDEHLTLSNRISALSKSGYSHIQLRCIRPFLDFKTASTIATSIVHSKLDYCNSLYFNLPKSQLNRLQRIQNSLVRAVVKAPKFSHRPITPILKSLHWLKINECIITSSCISHRPTVTTTRPTEPSYLYNLICLSLFSPSQVHSFLLFCHHLSTIFIFFFKNYKSLISFCITTSLESSFLSHFVSLLISLLHIHCIFIHGSSCTSSFLPSSTLSLLAQNLPFSQVFPTIDFWYLSPGLPSRT